MAEFSFLIKVLVEHQVTVSVAAADEDAAHELAWDNLPELKDLTGNPAVTSKVLSRSVLPADAAKQQASPPPPPQVPPAMPLYGRLLLTRAIDSWMKSDPAERDSRSAHLQHCLHRHINGEDGDIPAEDALLNAHVRRHPNDRGRLISAWTHPGHPVIWIITDGYATADAVTTLLFPDDY